MNWPGECKDEWSWLWMNVLAFSFTVMSESCEEDVGETTSTPRERRGCSSTHFTFPSHLSLIKEINIVSCAPLSLQETLFCAFCHLMSMSISFSLIDWIHLDGVASTPDSICPSICVNLMWTRLVNSSRLDCRQHTRVNLLWITPFAHSSHWMTHSSIILHFFSTCKIMTSGSKGCHQHAAAVTPAGRVFSGLDSWTSQLMFDSSESVYLLKLKLTWMQSRYVSSLLDNECIHMSENNRNLDQL